MIEKVVSGRYGVKQFANGVGMKEVSSHIKKRWGDREKGRGEKT